MRHIIKIAIVIALNFLLLNALAFAHHGSASSYDLSKVVTLTGTVTEFAWANPHSQIYFDVKDESGKVIHWAGEMNSPGILASTGWTRRSVKPGDQITINLCPAKSGAAVGLVGKVMLANGTSLQGSQILLQNKASQ